MEGESVVVKQMLKSKGRQGAICGYWGEQYEYVEISWEGKAELLNIHSANITTTFPLGATVMKKYIDSLKVQKNEGFLRFISRKK